MVKKRIDLTINKEVLLKFRKKCLDDDISVSKKVEGLMINDLKLERRRENET